MQRMGLVAFAALLLAGCGNSLYYGTWERLGKHKRDILSDRVRAGQDDQREAEEQILSTYELFKQASGFAGGELEDFYTNMNREFEASEAKAEQVSGRIRSIESVAEDLFEEWQQEIDLISSSELRRKSSSRLTDTKRRYESLISAMRRAETRMQPVLVAFRDQVLFLKHNLNASAVASLEDTAVEIESDVDALVRDMQRSIREAESFLAGMEG